MPRAGARSRARDGSIMMSVESTIRRVNGGAAKLSVAPLEDTSTFKNRAYAALKEVIVSLNIYDQSNEVRLDERQLAQSLGVSRTPVREAMAQLEREGFVHSVPRRVARRRRNAADQMGCAPAFGESRRRAIGRSLH